MKNILIFVLAFIFAGCVDDSPPTQNLGVPPQTGLIDNNPMLSDQKLSIDTIKPATATPVQESTTSSGENSTVNLEIKENISLDRSLTFYDYSGQKSGYKSDKTFYFILNNGELTLEELDGTTKLILTCDFVISKPWGRTIIIEGGTQYNVLKTAVSSKKNPNLNLEITATRLDNKVRNIKLGGNTFYSYKPIEKASPKVAPSTHLHRHQVLYGESVKRIAAKYCMTQEDMELLNPELKTNPNFLKVGQFLNVK